MAQTHHPSQTLAVLDIGTTKVACFIAEIDPLGNLKVLGIGHQLSRGIRGGHVIDIADAETSIVATVHAAEQMADTTIDTVVVNLSGLGVTSRMMTVELRISSQGVSERDIQDVVQEARESIRSDETVVLHCFPVDYTLDEVKNIKDPRGMFGEKLTAELHLITAPAKMVRNITQCLARCHLNIAGWVVSPFASAIACLEPDEMELGVTLIDMGGGITSVAVFSSGKSLFVDMVPIGGTHVTSDLAKGLSTSLTHAERLKTLHGSAIATSADDQVTVDVPLLGEEHQAEGSNPLPRSMLVGIIRPRLEEIFEMIRSKLEVAGVDALAGRRVVLTGGASQLLGMRDLATRVLGKQARLSKPHSMQGLADAVSGPAFSCALGMLEYTRRRTVENQLLAPRNAKRPLKKIVSWIKENF